MRKQPQSLVNLGLPGGYDQFVQTDCLLLDPENLRLLDRVAQTSSVPIEHFGEISTQLMLRSLLREHRFKLDALITSIKTNGFLAHERLIVAPFDGTRYLVLEGNRRLASVQTILAEALVLEPKLEQSLLRLPCFVINGDPVSNDRKKLEAFRRHSELYIGLRHLMGAKSWEPASRYEFQKRLLDDGWSPEQVAATFGRPKAAVLRDLKAQKLYQMFLKWSMANQRHTFITYNAFAEVARSPDITKWLKWSDAKNMFTGDLQVAMLFRYIRDRIVVQDEEDDNGEAVSNAESVVRRFRDMLKLNDADVLDAVDGGDFDRAEILFEERKHGHLEERVKQFNRVVRSAQVADLERSPNSLRLAIEDLIARLNKLLHLLP